MFVCPFSVGVVPDTETKVKLVIRLNDGSW